jgi:lipoate-protein ligase A
LQHGSILLGTAHEGLADVLNLANDNEREEVRRVIRSQSVSLQEVWGEEENAHNEITWERCADALCQAFGVGNISSESASFQEVQHFL